MGTEIQFYGERLQHFSLHVLEAIKSLIPSFHRSQVRMKSKSSFTGKYKTELLLVIKEYKTEA